MPILITGTCVKILRANDKMTIFQMEDVTMSRVVEIFRDKLPFLKEIELGKNYLIKGEYTLNYFNEKIIRAYKIKEIKMDEEFLFYLEI